MAITVDFLKQVKLPYNVLRPLSNDDRSIDINPMSRLGLLMKDANGYNQGEPDGWGSLYDLLRLVSPDIKSELGWWNIKDTTQTEINPTDIPSNTNTKLIFNPDEVTDTFSPVKYKYGSIYDSNSNSIKPIAVGDSYLITISLEVNPSMNNRNLVIKAVENNSNKVLWLSTNRLARGAGNNTNLNEIITVTSDTDLVNNGFSIYLECDGSIQVFNLNLLIQRLSIK